jgi:hypothetical protein
VYKGYIEPSEYIAEILHHSILSRQGERWQVFGEDPGDFTDCLVLCRELLLQKGFGEKGVDLLNAELAKNGGHVVPGPPKSLDLWKKHIPLSENSENLLLLDDATASLCPESAEKLGMWFKAKGMDFISPEPVFMGFEYFACGLVDEGIAHLENLVKRWKQRGVKKLLALSGQTEYLFVIFAKKLGIDIPFEITGFLDLVQELKPVESAFIYGGSFYLRYLGKAARLAELFKNSREEPVADSPEFSKLIKGDRRLNALNIWQKPASAEYVLFEQAALAEDILRDCAEEIRCSGAKTVAAFDPYAFVALKKALPDIKVFYWFDLLEHVKPT